MSDGVICSVDHVPITGGGYKTSLPLILCLLRQKRMDSMVKRGKLCCDGEDREA